MATKSDRKRARPADNDNDNGAVDFSIEDNGLLPSAKKAKTEQKRSLFVRSLPASATNETLVDFFSEYFPVKHATVVVDQQTKESRGFGFVTLADADDATQAKATMDKKLWDGKRIRIEVAEPRQRKPDGGPRTVPEGKPDKQLQFLPTPKLIIRNLPWSIKTPAQLSKLFMSFGKVKFADLPNDRGKLKGFGFVTLRGRKQSQNAIEAINGLEVDGRQIAVDWAVDQKTWKDQNKAEEVEPEPSDNEIEIEDEDEDAGEDADEDADEAGDDESDKGSIDADLQNFMKNHMQNMEDEDDDDEKNEDDKQNAEHVRKERKPRMTDNSSTLFIRNLPFTASDESLKSFFESFGHIRYARVVMDKTTQKPAGTGFVCFAKEAEAKACVKAAPRSQQTTASAKHSILQDDAADPTGKYTLDGRLLQVAQAVNKEQATHLADNASIKRRETDKRKLFLMAEGAISQGTPLYDLLTPMEVRMRQASAAQRRKLVQGNPSLHMSLHRLALRNIPRSIDSKELKELARKAVVGFATELKDGKRQPLSKEELVRDGKDAKSLEQERKTKKKGIIRQAKVVFESMQGTKVSEDSGAGKSRGYGFIEYTSHRHALMGLRFLNGHQLQGDGGRKQRLVAEFAIENAQVVQRRRAIESKSAQPPRAKREEKKKAEGAAAEEKKGKKPLGKKPQGKGKMQPKGPNVKKEVEIKATDSEEVKAAAELKHKLIQRTRVTRKKKKMARGKA